jgi:thymidylate kinase
LRQAQQNPKEFFVVDAGRSPDEVFLQLTGGLQQWCAKNETCAPRK